MHAVTALRLSKLLAPAKCRCLPSLIWSINSVFIPLLSQLLSSLTTSLLTTYRACNPTIGYNMGTVPPRVLTKPSEAVDNGGQDNANADLIVCINDTFTSSKGAR